MKELKLNIKLLSKRKEFYFAILAIFMVNIIQVFLAIQRESNLGYFIENSYSSDYQFILYNGIVIFEAIIIIGFTTICSMILADSTWLEYDRKTINLLFQRIDIKKNNLIRYILSFFVSFLICCLAFLLNHMIHKQVFSNDMTYSYFQSLPFYENFYPNNYFLDDLRYKNPTIYMITLNFITSMFIGLLSTLSYSASLFIKKRIYIYFIPILTIILSTLICPVLGIPNLMIVNFLQSSPSYTISDVVIVASILFVFSLTLLIIYNIKKDLIL